MKKFLRNIRLRLGRIFLNLFIKESVTNINIKKILFMRQDGKIGDYIVSSFVFRELKKHSPSLHIGVVCNKRQAYLFEQNPYIDKCYLVKTKSILDYVKCGLRIRKEKYDVVIDPTVLMRNRDLILLRLIHAAIYIGYKKSDYKIFNINLENGGHFSELYKQALEKIGFKIHHMQYDIPYNHNANEEIRDFLDKNSLNGYIAINFFGASNSRKINDENIIEYIEYLQKIAPNRSLVLLSYPDVWNKLQKIAKNFQQVFVFNITHIFHTIELIRYADLLISPDTSTIHIASGLNKKIIALYSEGIENFTHWKPMSQEETHIIFYKEHINEVSPEKIRPEWLNN